MKTDFPHKRKLDERVIFELYKQIFIQVWNEVKQQRQTVQTIRISVTITEQ